MLQVSWKLIFDASQIEICIILGFNLYQWYVIYRVQKVNQARLGVFWTIYVNVDSPNLGFTYFIFLGGGS